MFTSYYGDNEKLKSMYSGRKENSKQEKQQRYDTKKNEKKVPEINGQRKRGYANACIRKEKKKKTFLHYNQLNNRQFNTTYYMAWLSMLRTTAASSTLRRRRNLRAQSRFDFLVRSLRSLSSLTRPSGNESHLHLRGCMVGDILWTFLRCRRRLQFWFLLGLKARLHTGHNSNWDAEEVEGVGAGEGAEPIMGVEAVVGLEDEDSGVSGRRWWWWCWI